MAKEEGWKYDTPDDTRKVIALRELSNGEQIEWECFYDDGWYTYDGIRIEGIVKWKEKQQVHPR